MTERQDEAHPTPTEPMAEKEPEAPPPPHTDDEQTELTPELIELIAAMAKEEPTP